MDEKTLKKFKIGVIMGGVSSEREISLLTGASMVKELRSHGHVVKAIDLDSRSLHKIVKAKIDVALLALHGTYGEDGVIQSVLEFLGIPYTGSGVLASALAMDKIMAKKVFGSAGIPTPKWAAVSCLKEVTALNMPYPLVFKPRAEGSAVGVKIAFKKNQARSAYIEAAKFGCPVLVEEYVKGKEISVPVMEDRHLPIIEITPKNKFYDYEAKYSAGMSAHTIPARLEKGIYEKAGKLALAAHKALGCRDYSRVDIIARGRELFVLEVNTLPGMTSLSLYPESAAKAGIGFYELLLFLLKKALGRKK